MEDQSAPAIDPLLAASKIEEQKRQTRRRWMWILLGLGPFLVICLVLLGIVATLVVPNVLEKFAFVSRKKVEVDITSIDVAIKEFAIANGGKFPDRLEELTTPELGTGRTYLGGDHIPRDPWGREYMYEPPGPGQPMPIVRSYGRDGQPGGEGDDADIDNVSIRQEDHRPLHDRLVR